MTNLKKIDINYSLFKMYPIYSNSTSLLTFFVTFSVPISIFCCFFLTSISSDSRSCSSCHPYFDLLL